MCSKWLLGCSRCILWCSKWLLRSFEWLLGCSRWLLGYCVWLLWCRASLLGEFFLARVGKAFNSTNCVNKDEMEREMKTDGVRMSKERIKHSNDPGENKGKD